MFSLVNEASDGLFLKEYKEALKRKTGSSPKALPDPNE